MLLCLRERYGLFVVNIVLLLWLATALVGTWPATSQHFGIALLPVGAAHPKLFCTFLVFSFGNLVCGCSIVCVVVRAVFRTVFRDARKPAKEVLKNAAGFEFSQHHVWLHSTCG